MLRVRGLWLVGALCLLSGCARVGPKQYLELAPQTPPGAKADPSLAYLASDVISLRLRDIVGTDVAVKAGRIRVGFQANTDRDWLVRVCTARGELTFVLIPEELEVAQTEPCEWTDAATGKDVPTAEVLRRGKVVFSGADLNGEAEVVRGARPGTWEVRFEFGRPRKQAFEAFTRSHIGSCLAIVLDGEVLMAPVIKSRIPGTGAVSGDFTRQEAQDLARLMNSGPLPVALSVVDSQGQSTKG